jgi:hypothetical protein
VTGAPGPGGGVKAASISPYGPPYVERGTAYRDYLARMTDGSLLRVRVEATYRGNARNREVRKRAAALAGTRRPRSRTPAGPGAPGREASRAPQPSPSPSPSPSPGHAEPAPATNAQRRAARTAKAAGYGTRMGDTAAARILGGIGAADAEKVIAAHGELGMPGIAEAVPERSLARDLGARPGGKLAADMHAAMVAGFESAYRARAIAIAEAALPLTLFVEAGTGSLAFGSPVVPVWLFAPCSSHGLGGVAAGAAGA